MSSSWLKPLIVAGLFCALPAQAEPQWRLQREGRVLKTDYFEVVVNFDFMSSSSKTVYGPHLEQIAGGIPEVEAQLDAKPELYPLKPGERIKLKVRLVSVDGTHKSRIACRIDLRIPTGRILYTEFVFPDQNQRAETYSKAFLKVRESLAAEYTLQADPLGPYRRLVRQLGIVKVELAKRVFQNRTEQAIVDNLSARLRKIPEPPKTDRKRRKWAMKQEGTVEQVLLEMKQWPALFKLGALQTSLQEAGTEKQEFAFIHPKDIRTRQLLALLNAQLYSPDFLDLFDVVHDSGGRFTMQATTETLKAPYYKVPGSYRIKGTFSVEHPKLGGVSIPFEFNVTSTDLEFSRDWHQQFFDDYETQVTRLIKSKILENLDRPPVSPNCQELLSQP